MSNSIKLSVKNLTILSTLVLFIASYFIVSLQPFGAALISFWQVIWWAVLLGVLIAGLIDATIPSQLITAQLGASGPKSILKAALLGFVMSVCSHGILAISMQLYKKGASTAAVITFLLASPWANISITIMLFAFFGLKALAFIGCAIVIACITGFSYLYLEKVGVLAVNPNATTINDSSAKLGFAEKELGKKIARVGKGMKSSARMVLPWIIIGTMLGALVEAYVPHEWMTKYMGPTFLGLMATLGIATVMEICSEGTAPLAFTIYKQTQAFGNAFVFLMAGVITDFTEIALIWGNIGPRAAILLPVITIPQTLLVGYVFNYLW